MKSLFAFFARTVSAFFASFLLPFPHLKSDLPLEELSNPKSLIGKDAIVTVDVTPDTGKVKRLDVEWEARLYKDSSVRKIDVGTEVTIKETEGNVLFVC